MLEKSNRIESIDLLRGLVMVIMALDHIRNFAHHGALMGNSPLDFSTTSTYLFLTRWITHFCAPVFVFLAGTSAFLYGDKIQNKKQLSRFLFTRGLWLILIEVIIVSFAWRFSFSSFGIGLQVIWAIGISMVFLSALVYLPWKMLMAVGIVIVALHNALDGFSEIPNNISGVLWSLTHVQHGFRISDSFGIFVAYPFLPWLGLMIMGYCTGILFHSNFDPVRREKILFRLGCLLILLFILLRSGNFYGDYRHWKNQATGMFTILSFINTVKYPPSLLFMLMTIGPALIFLSFAEKIKGKLASVIVIIGRVPFFFYICHLYLFHLMAWVLILLTGQTDFRHLYNGDHPDAIGFQLRYVYFIWISGLVILYFACRWYNRYKSTHRHWWLRYL